MSIKTRKFADDGRGIWIDGDDRSTVYLNEWINPKDKSYVDIGVRIYGAKKANDLNIYVPFEITEHEIADLSVELSDDNILRGLFNANGIVDAEKNEYTSDLKYDGRTVSLINLSKEILKAKRVAEGTVITAALNKIQQHITSDEAYELNDSNCYRIRRLEEDLYINYASPGYDCSDVITYQWVEERDKNMKAHYNFYFDIVHSKISQNSVLLYVLIMLLTAVAGNAIYGLIRNIIMLL